MINKKIWKPDWSVVSAEDAEICRSMDSVLETPMIRSAAYRAWLVARRVLAYYGQRRITRERKQREELRQRHNMTS